MTVKLTVGLDHFRKLDHTGECVSTDSMPINQFTRIFTRALMSSAAYDSAIVEYCGAYYDKVGVLQDVDRHDTCHLLKSPVAAALLWSVYLDSDYFKDEYKSTTKRIAPALRDGHQEPKSTFYAGLVRKMRVSTKKEISSGDADNAHKQHVRKIAIAASEVDLLDYDQMSRNSVHYRAKDGLRDFFRAVLPKHLDRHWTQE